LTLAPIATVGARDATVEARFGAGQLALERFRGTSATGAFARPWQRGARAARGWPGWLLPGRLIDLPVGGA